MRETVAVAKEADRKQEFSPGRSDNSIHRVQNEHEMQLGTLGGVIDNIRSNGGRPSVESIATQLSSIPTRGHAPTLLALQQTHGNRYVQRVVAGIQAKLVVGPPRDIYEQEADRVADEVMRMPEPPMQRQIEEEEELVQPKLKTTPEHRIQRQEGEEEILLTKKREDTTPEVTHDLESRIHALRGGGQPLPEHLSAYFEPRFGYDFSHVRVHTDAKAAESARTLNARAYTMGRDVAFGAGQYAPGTYTGDQLLAHELTHTIQQGSSVPRLQHKIVDSQIVDTPEMEDASIRMLKRSSTTLQSMPASYSAKLIQRDADKPPIKTSNNTIDAQRENAGRWADAALTYGIVAHRVDSETNERVGWAKLLEIFRVAYGDPSKYHENDIRYKQAGKKPFIDKETGKMVQRKVDDRIVEWCGIFAVYVLKKAGVQIGNWNSSLDNLLNQIKPGTLPKKGDIAFRKEKGHMAVVTDVKKRENTIEITTVNGNSDDGKILKKADSMGKWNAFYDLGNPK